MPLINLSPSARRCQSCGSRVVRRIQRDMKRKRFCSPACRLKSLHRGNLGSTYRRGDPGRPCTSCGVRPPNVRFATRKGKNGYMARASRCYDCSYAAGQASRLKRYGTGRNHGLVTRYGISEADVSRMIAEQNGRCALCGKLPKRLVVDHDHVTGRIRALLCDGCNAGMGQLGGTVEGLARAIKYIRDHEERISPTRA